MSAKPKTSCNAPRCIYSAETVKKAVRLSQFFRDEGYPVTGSGDKLRTVAKWRDGERDSVSIDDEDGVWNDHGAKEGGDVITAYQKIHGGSPLAAIQALGDKYHVTPTKTVKAPSGAPGANSWRKVATYDYCDESGAYLYSVDRLEREVNGKREKKFRQRRGDVFGLGDVRRVLYNLPQVLPAPRVFIVEGEKDVETLRKRGIVATTNSGGANYWREDFNAAFTGKAVIIIADNDAPGLEHAEKIAGQLVGVAKSVKVLTISKLPKGDITDWIEREGGSIDALEKLVADAQEFAPGQADAGPITNYTLERVPGKDGKEREVAHPKLIADICKDITGRFGGFPKKLGSALFDFDPKAEASILELTSPEDLSAWAQRRGSCCLDFMRRPTFPSWREVYANLQQTAERFDAVARAPFWPGRRRSRTFALYGELPQATGGSSAFWKLLDFMSPATAEDRLLMAAFFIAPMFFSEAGDIARPGWAIDTTDGQGAGKTSVVETDAKIYDCVPIALDFASLDARQAEVKKRLISTEGRATRIALFDNVTRTVKSATLAELITSSHITERKAYGRGEESRPNDLTFCLTFNGGKFDTDGAVRFYPVKVKEPEAKVAFWKRRVFEYIDTNRPQLFADIIAMLEAAQRRIDAGEIWTRSKSRFPEFDALVLGAVCKDRGEFDALDAYMAGTMSEANDDADKAAAVETAIINAMQRCPGWDAAMPTVLFAGDIDALMDTNAELARLRVRSRDLRAWIQSGLLPRWSKDFRRLENDRDKPGWRAASFLFGLDLFSDNAPTTDVQVVKADWGRRDGQTSGTIAGYTKLRGRWR